jgi:hypothetical protein
MLNSPEVVRRTPITSILIWSNTRPWARTQAIASPRSRRAFCQVIASSGRAEPHSRPRLDLADDKRPAVEGHDVDLAQRAAPVPSEHRQAGIGKELRRQLLTLLTKQVLRVHGHHLRRPPCRT